MKKYLLLISLICVSVAGAQDTGAAEPLLTPNSQLTLQDGEYARQLTGAQLKNEFAQYEADLNTSRDVQVEQVEPQKWNYNIPMATEDKMALVRQAELFVGSAVDYRATADVPNRAQVYEMKTGYNQQWGKKDKFAAYIDALLRIHGNQEYRALDAHCNAGGYVFNYHARALEFNMAMRNGSSPSAHTVLRIFGKTKYSSSASTVYTKKFFQNEIGKTVRFFIGPVPVSVRGSIGGSAGFDANVSVVAAGVKGQVKPGITSYGKADAGVDLWFVKAGVEGSLDLLIDYLPASLTIQLVPDNGGSLDIALNVTNQLKALSGKVTIFVKVKEFWKFWKNSWKKYSTTLFSWSGIQKTWVLFNKGLKIKLG